MNSTACVLPLPGHVPVRHAAAAVDKFTMLDRAIQAEGMACELRVQSDLGRLLYLRNGSILQSSSTETSGCSARVVEGRISGFAASALADDIAISTVLKQARGQYRLPAPRLAASAGADKVGNRRQRHL